MSGNSELILLLPTHDKNKHNFEGLEKCTCLKRKNSRANNAGNSHPSQTKHERTLG
ncbi:hypothetical protein HYC85_031703 [Camellia sinensis]|uniref:Uncharacterized protein n=1 Tax=Camellia sinensis TaxID=4442 RepID=A0A7J7FR85_CAMSI|nr:hypothetical protein HYC85_031703 [Camellia sinensis]